MFSLQQILATPLKAKSKCVWNTVNNVFWMHD